MAGAVFAAMERALLTNDTTIEFVAATRAHAPVQRRASRPRSSILLWATVLAVPHRHHVEVPQQAPIRSSAGRRSPAIVRVFLRFDAGPVSCSRRSTRQPRAVGRTRRTTSSWRSTPVSLGYVGFTSPRSRCGVVTGRSARAGSPSQADVVRGAFRRRRARRGWSYEARLAAWAGPGGERIVPPWSPARTCTGDGANARMLRVRDLTCSRHVLVDDPRHAPQLCFDSVHSFTESRIWILRSSQIVLTSIGLIGWRGDRLRSPGRIDSRRRGAFLFNNLLFAVFVCSPRHGVLIEAIGGASPSAGRSTCSSDPRLRALLLMAVTRAAVAQDEGRDAGATAAGSACSVRRADRRRGARPRPRSAGVTARASPRVRARQVILATSRT